MLPLPRYGAMSNDLSKPNIVNHEMEDYNTWQK